MLIERWVGERRGVRLYVLKLEIRVGGAFEAYEMAQRQGDGRLQSRNEGLHGGMRREPVCSAVTGPAVQGVSVSGRRTSEAKSRARGRGGVVSGSRVWKVLCRKRGTKGTVVSGLPSATGWRVLHSYQEAKERRATVFSCFVQ